MDTSTANLHIRQRASQALAVVGFIALVGAGIWLAVYSTRFVPAVISRIGTAAVYLGSVFSPSETPNLSVVPTPVASTTISFGDASSTVPAKTPATTPPKRVPTTVGPETSRIYPMNGTGSTQTFSGLPDLITNIDAVGYFATSSMESSALRESFVASSTVPTGFRPAVHFTIKNIGTNATGVWRWSASIPTQSDSIQESQPQQSLNPTNSIEYWFGFDYLSANKGVDKMISITANFDHTVGESNTNNNSASAKVTILGN